MQSLAENVIERKKRVEREFLARPHIPRVLEKFRNLYAFSHF